MKKILSAVGVLLVLLVAGVLIGPGLVDWNQYKADIQAQAKNLTGRALTINGDIQITVLPAPALIASDVSLANVPGAAAKSMMSLKHLEVRVAMAPLLTGRIKVQQIKLVDPVIELEVLADGRNNWTFEAGKGKAAPVPSPGTGPGTGTGEAAEAVSAPPVALDDFTIQNGTLIYRDAKAGTVERVENINAHIAAASLSGPFKSDGALKVRGIPLTYDINVGKIIHGRTVPFNLKLGIQPASATVQMTGTVVGLEGEPKIKGKVKGEGASLAGLIQSTGHSQPGSLPGLLGQPFSFEGAVSATVKGGGIKALNIRLGKTQASGDVKVDMEKGLNVAVGLSAKRIDLDTWLSLPPVSAAKPGKPGSAARKAPSSGQGAKPPAVAAAPAPAAPFAIPKNVTASLAFSAEAITYRNGVIRDAVLNIDLANGEATISQLSGQFPGGSELAVFGFVTEVQGKPRFEGELQSSANDLHGVLRWLGQDLKGIRPDRLRKVTLATRVVAVPEQIQLTGLDLQFDSSRLTGGVAIAMTKRLSFGADITLDRLNLDAYLPKQPAPAEKKPAPAKKKGSGKTAAPAPASGPGAAKKKTQQENPFSAFKMLGQVDVNLKARIKTVVYQGSQIKDITFDGTLYNGSLEIRRFSMARMAGAQVTLSGGLKGLDGMPEASGLTFNVRAGDMAKLFRFSGLDPALAPQGLGPVTFSGRIDGKLLAPTVKVKVEGAGATVQLNGKLEELAGTPAVKGLRFQLNAADPTGLLKLAGIKTPGAAKQLGAIRVTGSLDGNILRPALTLNLNAAGGTVALSGPVNTLPVGNRVDFSLKAAFPDLARLARALGADYRPAGKIGGLDLQARLRGGPKELTLTGMTAKIGAVQVTGDVVVGLEGPRPNIKANLSAGALVIDPFLPIGKTASLWPGTKIMPAAWMGPNRDLDRDLGEGGHPLARPVARNTARSGGRWSRDPIDLTGLAAFDGDIRFKSPSVRFDKYSLQNADLSLKLAKGRVNAEKLTGMLFGGALHATGTVTASARPRIETAFALENMDIGQATRALTGKSVATGRMSLKARLQTSGRHMADMVSGLSGSGSIRLKGMDVKQGKTGTALAGALGLVTALNQFAGVLGGGSKKGSGRVDISGTFDITGGIARSQDIKVAASVGNGTAQGSVDLPRWRIDVKGQVQLAQNLLTAFLSARTKRDVTQAVPFTVRGRLDAPTIKLDTSKLPGGALPIPGMDKLLKKAPKGVGRILQGILGGGRPPPPPEPTQPQPQTQKQPQPQPQPRVIRPEDLLKELFRRR